MLNGFDDIDTEKYSIEKDGTVFISCGASTFSEFLLCLDQETYGSDITGADLVVTNNSEELTRLSGAVDISISGTAVDYAFGATGKLEISSPVDGTYVYDIYEGDALRRSGRFVYENGALRDGFSTPTLTDGQRVNILYCNSILNDEKNHISATVTPTSEKTYIVPTE